MNFTVTFINTRVTTKLARIYANQTINYSVIEHMFLKLNNINKKKKNDYIVEKTLTLFLLSINN